MNNDSMDICIIGKKIRTIRLAKNLKLETVAELVSMSVTGYGNIERGHIKDIAINRIASIAKALEINIIELLICDEDQVVCKTTHNAMMEELKLCNEQKDKEIEYLKRQLDECGMKYKQLMVFS
jgi:transcriptional regulator with XRE-family HTH domain